MFKTQSLVTLLQIVIISGSKIGLNTNRIILNMDEAVFNHGLDPVTDKASKHAYSHTQPTVIQSPYFDSTFPVM